MKMINTPTPLTPTVFYILLALASSEKHGDEIIKQVQDDSQGLVKMRKRTLYGSLKRMLVAGLVEEAGKKPDPTRSNERRSYYRLTNLRQSRRLPWQRPHRYYRLTKLGRQALMTELQPYFQLVSIAQERNLPNNYSLDPSTVPSTDMQPPVASKDNTSIRLRFRERLLIRLRFRERLFKGSAWTVNVLATAILSILLGFNQPASDIPIVDIIVHYKLTVLVVLCVVIFLTLVVLLAFRSLDKHLRPMNAGLKAMGAVTSVSIVSCMLCLSLLGITLYRPSWCPSWLCLAPQPLIASGGVHDSNLQVTFQTLQSSIKMIPGDPSIYTLSNLPMANDTQLINTSQVLPYRVVLKIHSLQQGHFGLVIDQVTLLVNRQAQLIPHPLRVWIAHNVLPYNNNLFRVIYRGQATNTPLPALYITQPLAHVSLLPGETDELSLEVRSAVVADLHFQVQVTYHVIVGQLAFHILTLPNVFEIIFSDSSNWRPYQVGPDGHLVSTRKT